MHNCELAILLPNSIFLLLLLHWIFVAVQEHSLVVPCVGLLVTVLGLLLLWSTGSRLHGLNNCRVQKSVPGVHWKD